MFFDSSGLSLRWPMLSRPRPPAPQPVAKAMETGRARLPAGTRVYAIGDIHGMSSLAIQLVQRICDDAAASMPEPNRTIMVLCGDYIDRGPDSAGVLSFLSALCNSGTEVIALRGNHESMFQSFMEQPERHGQRWMANGGDRTLHSYGVAVPGGSPESYRQARAALARCMPMTHINFLTELRNSHVIGDYFFSHAGARPSVPLPSQTEADLLWIGDSFTNADHGFEKVIVHGHHPVEAPLIARHRIAVDTGAYATGCLSAAVLENAGCRFLQAAK